MQTRARKKRICTQALLNFICYLLHLLQLPWHHPYVAAALLPGEHLSTSNGSGTEKKPNL
jgi:hypothetical protein